MGRCWNRGQPYRKPRSKEAERRGLELRQPSKHQARILGLADPQQSLDRSLFASFSGLAGVRGHLVPASGGGEETACRGSSLAGQRSPHPTALLPLQHMVSHPLCSYEGSETNPILHMEKLGQEGRPGSRWQRLATSYTPGQGENWARFGAREEMGDSGPLLSQGRHKARSPHRTA